LNQGWAAGAGERRARREKDRNVGAEKSPRLYPSRTKKKGKALPEPVGDGTRGEGTKKSGSPSQKEDSFYIAEKKGTPNLAAQREGV